MSAPPGRPRNADIDRAVIEVTQRLLAEHGYEALAMAAVAEAAGTTRAALYRRYATKADLATAAIAALAASDAPVPTDDPFADLVAELRAFARGVARPHGLGMVGAMLQEPADSTLLQRYRERIVAPRRRRIAAVLDRALAAGLIDPGPDASTMIGVAAAACTGVHYAEQLAGGVPVSSDHAWAQRTATFVWRGLGGSPPTAPAAR